MQGSHQRTSVLSGYMKPIALFYHCLFFYGDPPELRQYACDIIRDQMERLMGSGLLAASSHFLVGINGGEESKSIASIIIPSKAKLIFHGLQSRAENLTLVELEKWVPAHPNWNVLYFHAKGATHDGIGEYSKFSAKWKDCMMGDLVDNWRRCVADLNLVESVGCHFMRGMADGSQNIWAGNFWWANSNFLATIPSIFLRDRIKISGISNVESRYEAEVWIGNGKLPSVKEYRPNGGNGCP